MGWVSWVSTYGRLPKGTVGYLGFAGILCFALVGIAVYTRSVFMIVIFSIVGFTIMYMVGLISIVFVVIGSVLALGIGAIRGERTGG